jgi:RNA polymerase sporulation-specific sigma factor
MNQQQDLILLERVRNVRDEAAREELVKKYLPMVRYIVKNHYTHRIDFEDCLQEGSISLLRAIVEYDPAHYPIKFSTFAYICILRRIYNVIKQTYTKKAAFSSRAISIYTFLNDDESRTLLQTIPAPEDEPFFRIECDWVQERLDLVLQAYLSPVEYQVIILILSGYKLTEIENTLDLPFKVIDNARTRARSKLKKVLARYGSLVSPVIPMKPRKRKDLNIRLEVS